MITVKNNITLIGKMGSDVRITTFESGAKVARFELAQNKNIRTNSGRTKNLTEWHKVFAWGNLAQLLEEFGGKGKSVAIAGWLVNRTYVSQEGKVRKITEIEIRQILGLT